MVAGGLGEVLLIITAVSAVPPPGGPLQTRPGPRYTPCTGGGPGGTAYSKLFKKSLIEQCVLTRKASYKF